MNLEQLGLAIVAAWVCMRLIEAIVKPLWAKAGLDAFYLTYVALVLGTGFGYATGLAAFPVIQIALVNRIVTCLVIGLGPSFIYDLIDKTPETPAALEDKARLALEKVGYEVTDAVVRRAAGRG